MKNNLLLFALVLSLAMASCGKDDPVMEKEEITEPSFKATFDWQDELFTFIEVPNGRDSLPDKMDMTWDNATIPTSGDSDVIGIVNYALIVDLDSQEENNFDQVTHAFFANQVIGTDTTTFGYYIFGEIEEKEYQSVTLDVFDLLFSDEDAKFPDGSVLPLVLSTKSELALQIGIAPFFGEVDLSGSSFKISEYNQETNEVSGNFSMNWTLLDNDNNPTVPMLKIADGAFNKVPFIK